MKHPIPTQTTKHTPGPWRVAGRGEPLPAPDDLPADKQQQWNKLQAELCKPIRCNDGSFVIVKDGSGPVGTASFQGTAKRGKAWSNEDPEGLANARLIAAAPELLACVENVKPHGEKLREKTKWLQSWLHETPAGKALPEVDRSSIGQLIAELFQLATGSKLPQSARAAILKATEGK